MSRLEGSRLIPFPRETVRSFLSDTGFMVSSLEKVESILLQTPDRSTFKSKLGVGLLSSTVEVTLEVVERSPEISRFRAITKASGGTGLSEISLRFLSQDSGTLVQFEAGILERTGFLKMVSPSLLNAAAQSIIEETWLALEKKLFVNSQSI